MDILEILDDQVRWNRPEYLCKISSDESVPPEWLAAKKISKKGRKLIQEYEESKVEIISLVQREENQFKWHIKINGKSRIVLTDELFKLSGRKF